MGVPGPTLVSLSFCSWVSMFRLLEMTAINVHGSLVVVKPKPLTHETQTKC